MPTFIHGIGASENIDSSGEIVSIQGLDISSLDKDGVFNYEHKSDQPSQIVGKILKAKKIFTDKDCEDDYQKHFWDKCRVPYLYVMGELLDDYSDSAREVAGKFRYDADHAGQNERAIMNFSVEGAKIAKEGITVTRSIARKITLTVLPCNKAAVAEMVSVDQPKAKKSEIDELFKTEQVEIEVFQPDENSKLWELLKKEGPDKHAAKLGIKPFKKDMGGGAISGGASSALSGVGPTSAGGLMMGSENKKPNLEKGPKLAIAKPGAVPKPHERGNRIGLTSSGHGVFSHGMVGDYGHFGHQEHSEAAAAHQKVSDASKDPKMKLHHSNKARLHAAAAHTIEGRTRDRGERAAKLQTTASTATPNLGTGQKLHHPDLSGTMKPPGPQKKSEGMVKSVIGHAAAAVMNPIKRILGAAPTSNKLAAPDKESAARRTMPQHKPAKEDPTAPGAYGNTKPHADHLGMANIDSNKHLILADKHKRNAMKANSHGYKHLAARHTTMSQMHDAYAKGRLGDAKKLNAAAMVHKAEETGTKVQPAHGTGQRTAPAAPVAPPAPTVQGVARGSQSDFKRAQPKPLLPKSEDMQKAVDTMGPNTGKHSPRNHRVEKDPAKHDLFQGGHHMPRNPSAVAQNANSFSRVHNETNRVSQTGASHMAKALTAGSGLAAPNALAQGAVLGKESLEKDSKDPNWMPKDKKISNLQRQIDSGTYKPDAKKIGESMLNHPTKPLKGTKVQKSETLQRAEADYMSWNKREEFEAFMKSRMPSLTKSEIKVIGMTMLLQKSMKQEKLLKDFYNPSGGSVMGKSSKK